MVRPKEASAELGRQGPVSSLAENVTEDELEYLRCCAVLSGSVLGLRRSRASW